MHSRQEAVLLAVLPQGEQPGSFVIGETQHSRKVTRFVDGEHLVPDETARASKLDKLLHDVAISLQTVFIALAYLHGPILQLTYDEYKRCSHWKTWCIKLHIHLVSATKCRRGVLTDGAHETLRDIFAKIGRDFEAVLVDTNEAFAYIGKVTLGLDTTLDA